jgi:hypothetical protein
LEYGSTKRSVVLAGLGRTSRWLAVMTSIESTAKVLGLLIPNEVEQKSGCILDKAQRFLQSLF